MRRTILTAIASAALLGLAVPAATATQPAPHCKVLSVESVVNHVATGTEPATYTIVTTERCRGKIIKVLSH